MLHFKCTCHLDRENQKQRNEKSTNRSLMRPFHTFVLPTLPRNSEFLTAMTKGDTNTARNSSSNVETRGYCLGGAMKMTNVSRKRFLALLTSCKRKILSPVNNCSRVCSQPDWPQCCLLISGFLMYSVAKQSRQRGFWYLKRPNSCWPIVVIVPQFAQALPDGSLKTSGHLLISILSRFIVFIGISLPLWPCTFAQGH